MSAEAEVIEVEASEVADEPKVEEVVSTALEHRPAPTPSRQALMPLSADDVVAGMEAYQQLLPRLLDDSDYQQAGRNRRFVKKSGWRKIARAFNLSVTVESLRVERDADGNPLRAECVARASAPNGQVQDGDGYCSVDESRFDETGGRQKLENDLRATATTRAKNRAIADLVGMGEVSAEEINASGQPPAAAIDRASDDEQKAARAACGALAKAMGGDASHARDAYVEALSHFDNVCPKGLAVLLIRLAGEAIPAAETTDPKPDDTDLPA